jgi:hypothetical protein
MSTNIDELAFDESEGTLTVHTVETTPHGSGLEAVALDRQEHGVMVDIVDASTPFRLFVPYENIICIRQTL